MLSIGVLRANGFINRHRVDDGFNDIQFGKPICFYFQTGFFAKDIMPGKYCALNANENVTAHG